jgi:hypothetical protein
MDKGTEDTRCVLHSFRERYHRDSSKIEVIWAIFTIFYVIVWFVYSVFCLTVFILIGTPYALMGFGFGMGMVTNLIWNSVKTWL